jgi:hypothetical protein
MPFRTALRACTLLALLAFPASGHAASTVVPSSTSADTVVPAGGTRTVSLSCPSPSVALNAAVTRLGSAATLRRSSPGTGPGNWSFKFAAGQGARRAAEAELRCVRLALPEGTTGAGLEVRTRSDTGIRIAPGESEAVAVDCGNGYVATGYGLSRGTRGDVRVAAAVPSSAGWSFELENIGSRRATAGVSARCLRREVRARRGGARVELRFRVIRRRFDDIVVSGGRVGFVHACRSGQFSVATGSEVDPLDPIALVRSHAARRRGASWTFARTSPGDDVTNHLVCLGRGSRFR